MDKQQLYPSEIEQMCKEAWIELGEAFGDGSPRKWENIPQPWQTVISDITTIVVHRVQRGNYPQQKKSLDV